MNQRIRCAIYTRKSTDEGLQQTFNSLDAQREAGEAYIKSQQHEGWQAIATHYDDGNYSGGNMERPALKQIMADIEAGKVNVVVVYKVDRLTRSLADFAKIVEHFDKYKVSFVSVTQHFNTTSSMGRLTLNVLLSFAQFEREVTGERIRDKIAASKKKGMWMGGNLPLGYKVVDRKLLIQESEAVTVRKVFREFLCLGSVLRLEEWLRANNIRTRRGNYFLRGPLYTMLRNPLYLGLIRHKTEIYPGEHAGIIDRVTWDQARSLLDQNTHGQWRKERSTQPSLFTGIIFDAGENRYSPTHSNKNGCRYRYYTSRAAIHKTERPDSPARIPAPGVEKTVTERILSFLNAPSELLAILKNNLLDEEDAPPSGFYAAVVERAAKMVRSWKSRPAPDRCHFLKAVIDRIVVQAEHIEIRLRLVAILHELLGSDPAGQGVQAATKFLSIASVTCPFKPVYSGRALRLVIGGDRLSNDRSRQLILRAIARSRLWYQRIVDGEATCLNDIIRRDGIDASHAKKIFPLAFLSPSCTQSILRSNADLTLKALLVNIPMEWSRQNIPVPLHSLR
ncbi:MAG: recombinase family protein [Acidobacteriota bacterium]|nr:recombinase family protein [Acidobacteriota bacterium]